MIESPIIRRIGSVGMPLAEMTKFHYPGTYRCQATADAVNGPLQELGPRCGHPLVKARHML